MTTFLRNPRKKLFLCLTALLLSVAQTNLNAFSDTASLQPEEASVDTSIATTSITNDLAKSTLLNGSIHKSDTNALPAGETNVEKSAQAADATAKSTGDSSAIEKSNIYKLAVQKLGTGVKLSAEDYRNLNVGIVGMESTRTFYTNKYKVVRIVKGSPADIVGIKLGDTFMKTDSFDDSKVKDPTIPAYVFSCGLAGDVQDLTLQRHGKSLTFHIVKMNMEDLPELKDRQEIERMVSQTGFPANIAPVAAYGTQEETQNTARVQPHSMGFSILKILTGL